MYGNFALGVVKTCYIHYVTPTISRWRLAGEASVAASYQLGCGFRLAIASEQSLEVQPPRICTCAYIRDIHVFEDVCGRQKL